MTTDSATADDPFNLARFVDAQATIFAKALAELRAGEKESHWMWFVFPQFAGLGPSSNSRTYAIRSQAEAMNYLNHPLLGPRLRACAEALLLHPHRSAREMLGEPDDMKLQSCATLFDLVAPNDVFATLLERFFGDAQDTVTLRLVRVTEGPA